MRKEKSRDAARSRRSKENHEFYELAKLLPLPAAITSQLDFLDKASIIRLTISFLKLRQFSVNGHPPWAPDFATLGSINPYSSQSHLSAAYADQQQQQQYTSSNTSLDESAGLRSAARPTSVKQHAISPAASSYSASSATPSSVVAFSGAADCQPVATFNNHTNNNNNNNISNYHNKNATTANSLFDIHQGTHILQSLDGFAFAIGRDGRFLYISETVSMYLGLSQVEMTGSSVFDYTHQQDHEELAQHLGIQNPTKDSACDANACVTNQRPASVHSQYSAASNETLIEDYVGGPSARKRAKASSSNPRGAYGGGRTTVNHKRQQQVASQATIKSQAAAAAASAIKVEANTTSDNVDTQCGGASLADELLAAKRILDDRFQASADSVGAQGGTEEDPLVRQFCIRMKSTLTKRGCQHFKSSGYRVVHVVAHLRSYQSNDHGHLMDPLDEPGLAGPGQPTTTTGGSTTKQSSSSSSSSKRRGPKSSSSASAATKESTTTATGKLESGKGRDNESQRRIVSSKPTKIIGMVAVAIALPPPSINELRLESDTFVLRLGLDLKITHIEPRITELLRYPVELLAGRSLYSLIHPADAYQVQKCHRDLLTKGQMMSGYYRLLARDGGYIWTQTCATLICSSSSNNNNSNNNNNNALLPPQSPQSSMHQQPMTPMLGSEQSKLPGYLAPSLFGLNSSNNNNGSNSAATPKLLASPGMSSHISSNYDGQDQDQCAIFVNYMITNVIETEQIIDICQSQDFSPLATTFAAAANNNNHHHSNSNVLYTSPSSSCSSPCMKAASLNSGNQNSNHYVQSSTPTSANGGGGSMTAAQQRRQQANSNSKDIKTNNRRAHNKVSTPTKSASYLNLDENTTSYPADTHQHHHQHHHHQHRHNKLVSNNSSDLSTIQQQQHEEIPPETNAAIYSYHSTPGSVNLALNNNSKLQGGDVVYAANSHSGWLSTAAQHQQQHQHQQQTAVNHQHRSVDSSDSSSAMVSPYGVASQQQQPQPEHYSGRTSIYKAAFGLNATSYSSHVGQHHQQTAAGSQLYPATATGQVVAYGSTAAAAAAAAAVAPAVGNTWDNAAAVAAVAAASNLSNHHHHHHHAAAAASNPYAHLEPHHHHQAAAAAAAAAAAHANSGHHHHHHSGGAGNYYNYYGYYGNKFI